jgi:hypothetical protein
MAPYYTMQVYDSAGALQAVVTDFLSLAISKQLNAIDMLTCSIESRSPSFQYMDMGAIIQVWRQDVELGIPNTLEFSGIIRKRVAVREITLRYTLQAVGMLALLADRVIAYKANKTNLSKFTAQPAETIIKRLFNFNIGSSATTANGRLIDGRTTGFSTAATAGTGTSLTLKCSMLPLLKTIQEIAYTGGLAYTLTYTTPATWVFTTFVGQIGTDRTASIALSVSTGTVGRITQVQDLLSDFNTVIVGGSGTEEAKQYATFPTSGIPTGLDLRETVQDGKNQQNSTLGYLQQFGRKTLAIQQRRRVQYAVDVLQTSEMRYGRDYFFGDKITVNWERSKISQYVVGVGLEWKSTGDEVISVKLNS